MRALVTGCAGFIGSHLTESLLTDGHEVLAVDCFNNNYGRSQKQSNLEHASNWATFDFVPLDLARGDLEDLVEGVDAIFHLAAEPGVRPSWGSRFEQYVRNNVLATQHLLEAARRTPETRFVYASSSSIYGEAETLPTREDALPRPFSPYGMTKLSGEQLCGIYHGNFGVNVVSLRFFSVYGPRQRPDMAFRIFCDSILEGRPLEVFGDGGQTRDFTYVGDIVRAARLAATAPDVAGDVFNVGGGSRVALNDAIDLLLDFAEHPVEVLRGEGQRGDVRDTGADISRIVARLGFSPEVTFDQGLRMQWEWAVAQRDRRAARA